jgi:hypothetical protein
MRGGSFFCATDVAANEIVAARPTNQWRMLGIAPL